MERTNLIQMKSNSPGPQVEVTPLTVRSLWDWMQKKSHKGLANVGAAGVQEKRAKLLYFPQRTGEEQ